MATIDLLGYSGTPTTFGKGSLTHRQFEQVLFDLLPHGYAWDREDPVLQKIVAAQAVELSRVHLRARKLRRELNPATTFELLEEWETMLGLPDCAAPTSLEARRAAVLAKLLAQTGHDQSLGWWTDILKSLQYILVWVNKGKNAFTCESLCTDVLYPEEWAFVWELGVHSGLDDDLLVCTVEGQAQIETHPIVHYLWTRPDTLPGIGTVRALACTATGYMAAVGLSGLVYSLSPDLETWTEQAPLSGGDFLAVCQAGVNGDWLVAAGPAGVVHRSQDGVTWTAATDATAITVAVHGLSRGHSADDVVVAVGAGYIRRSTDAGDTWSSVVAPLTIYNAVTRCAGALIVVGRTGTIVRSTDDGSNWSSVSSGTTDNLYGVAAWGEVVIAVGNNGTILRSDDSGETWAPVESPKTEPLRAVAVSPTGRWVVCGDAGTLLYSLDGLTWTVQTHLPSAAPLYAAAADIPSGRLVVAGATDGPALQAYIE